MIPNKNAIEVQGNVPLKATAMDFDPSAIKHIMRLLIDLYSDAELAIIRELSTNAIDSHIMAGVRQPIEVQTPTPLSPYLVVQDYGLGLSEAEVYSLFGRYGASTKRGTNEATGMLGLGSKSPLTYTNQFTMTVIKDGEKVVVSIARDEEGVGQITTVAKSPTTDHNGVAIKIPAKRVNALRSKAEKFFQYWESGKVLLDGKEPTKLADTVLIADRISVPNKDGNVTVVPCPIHMTKGARYSDNASVVVMGNVPYPAGDLLSHHSLRMPNGYSVVATVPIGTVEFVPSREALAQDDAQTKRVLSAIADASKRGFLKSITDEVENAPTAAEALRIALNWTEALRNHWSSSNPLKWRGKELPRNFNVPTEAVQGRWGTTTQVPQGHLFMINPRYDTGRGKISTYGSVDASQVSSMMWVRNFPLADVTPTVKKKLKQWFYALPNDQQAKIAHVTLIDFELTTQMKEFIDPSMIMDWQVIGDQKLPKVTSTASGRIPGSFDVLYGGISRADGKHSGITRYGVPGNDLDQTKPLYWLHGNPQQAYRYQMVLDKLKEAEYTIICLPGNRVAKFKRENPKIVEVHADLTKRAVKMVDGMTDTEKLALAIHDAHDLYELRILAAYKLDDPDLAAATTAARTNIDKFVEARQVLGRAVPWPEDVPWENPTDKYLLWDSNLLRRASVENHEAMVRYLNCEYAYIKAQEAANGPV